MNGHSTGRTTWGRKQTKELIQNDQWLQAFLIRRYAYWRGLYDAVDAAIQRWRSKPQIGDTKPSTGAVSFRPRDHFRADGQPKRRMGQLQAKLLATELDCNAYECWVCNGWHVGHKAVA